MALVHVGGTGADGRGVNGHAEGRQGVAIGSQSCLLALDGAGRTVSSVCVITVAAVLAELAAGGGVACGDCSWCWC